jgi:hypothetical protein
MELLASIGSGLTNAFETATAVTPSATDVGAAGIDPSTVAGVSSVGGGGPFLPMGYQGPLSIPSLLNKAENKIASDLIPSSQAAQQIAQSAGQAAQAPIGGGQTPNLAQTGSQGSATGGGNIMPLLNQIVSSYLSRSLGLP